MFSSLLPSRTVHAILVLFALFEVDRLLEVRTHRRRTPLPLYLLQHLVSPSHDCEQVPVQLPPAHHHGYQLNLLVVLCHALPLLPSLYVLRVIVTKQVT